MFVEAIFWFHPLVWWIGARLVEERERACDEEVLRLGGDPQVYAEAILNVCKLYVESPLACVSGVTGADLKQRIEAIMKNRVLLGLSLSKKAALAAAGFAAVALPIVIGTMQAQTAPKPQFEVASIRPATGATPGGPICGSSLSPESVVSSSESVLASSGGTLAALTAAAYQDSVDGFDLPQWVRNGDRFALSVKIPPNTSAGTCRGMLRDLLAERFHLVTSVETREVARLYVKVAKSGLKLKPADQSAFDPKAAVISSPGAATVHYAYRATPISRIINDVRLNAIMEAQVNGLVNDPSFRIAAGGGVVDETGLIGNYDGGFDFYATPPPDGLAEPLKDILTRQLGLTLELRRASGKILVIRSGDRMPSEN
jgi:uncharacterized protein (TIGR03435 family)